MNINCKSLLKLTKIIEAGNCDDDLRKLTKNCRKQFKKLEEIEKHILGSDKKLINNKEQKQIIYEKWNIYCDAVNRLTESMNLSSSPKKSWIKKHVVELLSLSQQFEREWHSCQQQKINYVIFGDEDEEDNDDNNDNNDNNDNKTIDNHHYEKENYNSNDVVNNYHNNNNNHHHHHHYYCRHNRYCNRKHPRMIILKKINDKLKMKTERHLLQEATK